jgi:hypothetical protein
MKIIFEQDEFNSQEKEEFARTYFPNYRTSKTDKFEILVSDFPSFLKEGISVFFDVLHTYKGRIAKGAELISGRLPIEQEGNYIVECERIERHEGEIIQRVWVTFTG